MASSARRIDIRAHWYGTFMTVRAPSTVSTRDASSDRNSTPRRPSSSTV